MWGFREMMRCKQDDKMPDISIDRLTLELSGVSEFQARRLAIGITEGLPVAGLSNMARDVPAMRIDLTASTGMDSDKLAQQVISEILGQLRRSA
jgi:hypothetical protein